MNQKIAITAFTATTALGAGLSMNREALKQSRSGLQKNAFAGIEFDTYVGQVEGVDDVILPEALTDFDCRNNRLAELGLQQDGFVEAIEELKARYGAERIGLFIGTSTSGIQQTEMAYVGRDPDTGELPDWFNYATTHDVFSSVAYLSKRLGLRGPSQVISTACSSSSRVFAAAARHMQAGLCDAALVGGIDSLCQMTLYGFNSLQLVSGRPCRPADAERDGINIGEAAGYVLLEKERQDTEYYLLGYGESSDAWHMSSPHPEGAGAVQAMLQSLARAGLAPSQIDYINLHGTATPANDLAEDKAMMTVFEGKNPCSSTKGFTGHTLGAAGIVGAVFSCIAIEENLLPVSLNTQNVDEKIQSNIVLDSTSAKQSSVDIVMSNSLGFGGSNASLIIGRSL
jgi:3-oxoacyl-[acyl-carrier-protein] synthase-1